MIKELHQLLTEELGKRFIEKSEIPNLISTNLNPNFPIRPYQESAFKYFLNYWEESFEGKPKKNHQLLFHMATGSGKTLMMAGLICYLYHKGYRNFLFFVNSSNIINKTKDNFLNKSSGKYLFAENLNFNDKNVQIKSVQNFQNQKTEDINIVFETIQGLHLRINTPNENSITYEDFEDKKVVLISDEAHHINVTTKIGAIKDQQEFSEIFTWESTVERIFKANPENVMLEFTATVDFSDENLSKKYKPKLLFDYPLKEFRRDGYSKEVKVLQSDLSLLERSLQAILLSQYRRKIFEKHGKDIKPVILFKSKTIKDSQEFVKEFTQLIFNLNEENLIRLKSIAIGPEIQKVFNFLDESNISYENFIIELKDDFSSDKLISVNSKEESDEKQIAVNSLEINQYRAVFAVDKLNEGWDVLNLFDIVRLYDSRDSGSKLGKTTMSEAQLIGRGARYCPFMINQDQSIYLRKYDSDIENELRICEELFYHSAYNPKYIQELNTALQEVGIKAKETKERKINIKPTFKNTTLYKAGHIFLNKQNKYAREDIYGLDSVLISRVHKVSLNTGLTISNSAFDPAQSSIGLAKSHIEYNLTSFGVSIIRKAIQRNPFFSFNNLVKLLPNLKSIDEFISSESYLGKIQVEVSGLENDILNLSPEQKVSITSQILESIASILASDKVEFKGSKEFYPRMINDIFSDKTLNFMIDEGSDKEFGKSMLNANETAYYLNLNDKNWYVFDDCFGTSEEKLLVQYIDKRMNDFKHLYSEVYLIRNEKHFKLYNFKDGSALEPDFVLYLVGKEETNTKHYQIFIEPKGGHLLRADEWKEQFLLEIKNTYEVEQLFSNKEYILWGLPFFNHKEKVEEFDSAIKELLN
jgi:type III restriction enzyme